MLTWASFLTVKFMSVDDQIAILGSGNQGATPNFFFPHLFSRLSPSSLLYPEVFRLSNPCHRYRYAILVPLTRG